MGYVFDDFLLLLPGLLELLSLILRFALLQTFEQPCVFDLDALQLLPSERSVETAVHLVLVLVALCGASVYAMRDLLEEIAIFPLDFGKLVLLEHKALVLVENMWLPLPLMGAGPHIPQPLLVAVQLPVQLPLLDAALAVPVGCFHAIKLLINGIIISSPLCFARCTLCIFLW